MVADGSMSKMSSALLSHPNGEGLGLLEPGILLWTQGGGQCIVCVGHCSGGWPPDSCAVSVPGVLLPVCGSGYSWVAPLRMCPLIWHFREGVPTNLAFGGRCAH